MRISAGQAGRQDAGHASARGMTWHDGGELEALSITARPEEDGTSAVEESGDLERQGQAGVVLAALEGVHCLTGHPELLGQVGLRPAERRAHQGKRVPYW